MPFLDVQKRFGINLDRWWTVPNAEQPYKFPAQCHAFEKEWIECAHGIGTLRAEKECKIEYDDFIECILWTKTMKRTDTIWRQWEKLMKEGKYTPPPHHMGKGEPRS
ncbi:NADH dehydrogenase [ubiquinone] iron-sulfur protein 5-like [Saimiri boliviensis]|uniref:NADH dehydrogenase [ubiquinone] iron-sulfur protein 5-like n=1 Tax=Saimiri boliviensis TaxID=27679 RepID=UPI00193DE9E7|nr:NADH dehydrogenase [ubiquinone] iron-sulfur protein 5-like [Saimiri boliviensis boliviensis]